MRQKVIRAGKHSLAVIIPAPMVHTMGIAAGDTVDVRTDQEKRKMHIAFEGNSQLSLLPAKSSRKKNKKRAI